MTTSWDQPCYKCRSHYCAGFCREPEHLKGNNMNYAYESKDIRAQNMAAGIDREQSPRLMLKLATLEKSVHQLRDSLGQLGEKLNPITRPAQPLPEKDQAIGGATISSSPVVAQIENIESLIWDLNARVRHQIEEMDL